MIKTPNGITYSVESAYQASKVFEHGGPYFDLLKVSSYNAKKDPRLKTSGNIIGFQFYNKKFSTEPKTLFYNWLYISALNQHPEFKKEILEKDYTAFTDIAFSSKSMLNCQARALALYVALEKKGLLKEALKSKEDFAALVYSDKKLFVEKKIDKIKGRERD